MNKKNKISGLIKFMLISFLIITAFFNAPKYQWLYISNIGIVLIYITLIFIKKWLKKMRVIVIKKKPKKSKVAQVKRQPLVAEPSETEKEVICKSLTGHINSRITEKIRTAYPEATWEWIDKVKINQLAQDGTYRIKLNNTGEFGFADVSIKNFNLSFELIKIVRFNELIPNQPIYDGNDNLDDNATDINAWYDIIGKKGLEDIITDINTRGYRSLKISENGKIFAISDGSNDCGDDLDAQLVNFPQKSYWNSLIELFKKNELTAQIEDNYIQLSWS